jgi:hypothetical protein
LSHRYDEALKLASSLENPDQKQALVRRKKEAALHYRSLVI